jgi:hypothetical protein
VGDRLPESLLTLLDNADECRAIMNGMDPDEAKRRYRYGEDIEDTSAPDNDSEPCTLEEAGEILGFDVVRDEPAAAYKRGFTALTTHTLAAGIEGREEAIPEATRYRVMDIDFSDDPLNPVYTLDCQGKTVHAREEELLPPRKFAIGDTVYTQQETTTADGTVIERGTSGTVTKLYRYNPKLGRLRGHTYDVKWPEVGVEWMLEQELRDRPPTSGFSMGEFRRAAETRLAVLTDDDKSTPLEDAAPQVVSCQCETHAEPSGWMPGATAGAWQACPDCNPNGSRMPVANADDPEADQPPAIRVIKAPRMSDSQTSDDIRRAIRQTIQQPPQAVPTTIQQGHRMQRIPMQYAGQLTGAVMADVWCYGYATDAGTLIYLNMGGPRSGVEAIRGKLSKASPVNLLPDDGPAIELTPGEEQTGKYTAILNNMSDVRFMHCILIHERMTEPNYSGKSTTYIIQVDEAQARGQLLHHVRELVGLPVFDTWTDYLWQAGQTAMLVRNCRSAGGITVKAIALDREAWTRLITGGVAEDLIAIPQAETTTG